MALPAWFSVRVMPAQIGQDEPGNKAEKPGEVTLPNGKKQADEILKADYQKNLKDVRNLAELSHSVQEDLEREDRFVLSLGTLKKLEDIEKLAKRIRGRLKRF